MNNIEIVPGLLLKDNLTNKKYRVICILDSYASLCLINTSYKLVIKDINVRELIKNIHLKNFKILKEDSKPYISIDHLPEIERKKYNLRLELIKDINNAFAPTYKGLLGRKSKPELDIICKKYQLDRTTVKRIVNRYLQSGCSDYSLLTNQMTVNIRDNNYSYMNKTGRKNNDGHVKTGIVRDKYCLDSFNLGINYFLKGPNLDGNKTHTMTIKAAYELMLLERYNEVSIKGSGSPYKLLPSNEIPSYRQFKWYFDKMVSKEKYNTIKTSKYEVRNNTRLLTGDTVLMSRGPMDICEIDAWESDIKIVSKTNRDIVVGRPTIYAMIDTYSKMVVAVSISFERDSYIGLTNMFLNLADNVQDKLRDIGLTFDYFPMINGFLPNTIRTDNGSDFISDAFANFLLKQNIIHQTVPAASGSLKPNIERLWGQIRSRTEIYIENHGAILKRNDDNSSKTACLTLEEYTKIIYTAIIGLNQTDIENYPMRVDMLTYKDEFGIPLQPRPDHLWKYGIKKYLNPRIIINKEQYFIDLLKEGIASISKNGIIFESIPYLPQNNDIELLAYMYKLGTKRIKIKISFDPRNINNIWYIDDKNKIHMLKLNTNKTEAVDLVDMTYEEYQAVKKIRKQILSKSKVNKIKTDVAIQGTVRTMVNNMTSAINNTPQVDNLRVNHKTEKLEERRTNSISNSLSSNIIEIAEIDDNSKSLDKEEDNKSLDEMIMDIFGS